MTMRLETLAATAAALNALAKDYPKVAELRLGLSLILEELKKEINSVEKKQRAA